MKRRIVFVVAAVLWAGPLLAAETPANQPPPKLDDMKAMLLKRIDDRIAKANVQKACVTAAASLEELRACVAKATPRSRPVKRAPPNALGNAPAETPKETPKEAPKEAPKQ